MQYRFAVNFGTLSSIVQYLTYPTLEPPRQHTVYPRTFDTLYLVSYYKLSTFATYVFSMPLHNYDTETSYAENKA